MVEGIGEAFRALVVMLLLGGMACGGCAVGCGMKYGDTIRATAADWIAPTPTTDRSEP